MALSQVLEVRRWHLGRAHTVSVKIFFYCAFALLPALATAAHAAPPTRSTIPVQALENAAINKLFARAAKVYGGATAVKMNYATQIKLGEDNVTARGILIFEAPARFRYEHEILGDKTTFVYDGYTLMMQAAGEKAERVAVAPNQTVWDALPDVSLPDPLIDSFLAGQNALDDFKGGTSDFAKLPALTIGGALCDGARIKAQSGEDALQISAYFNRATGALQRVITQSGETILTTDYSEIDLDAVVAPGAFSLALNGAKETIYRAR